SRDNLKVSVESLKNETMPAIILLDEQSRRFREMSKTFGNTINPDLFPVEETLVLNLSNPLIRDIIRLYEDQDKKSDALFAAGYVYDLAVLNHKQLDPERMAKFIEKSNELLRRMTKTEAQSA
ncbi:MAG TPA: molecular chaperone HtpG, partial [Thermoclostridium caenicola]|nr:molecular chaperone HtpG [Thermoclostridium caenicola]